MPIVVIDGKDVEIPVGQKLNGIQAAALAGVEIPHYCWHPGLSVVASCRMCLVESGTKNRETGQIQMVPKLVPACQTPAVDGTVFITNSEKVLKARAMVEEDLLIDHPIDCPICDKAGECRLQDYHFAHGQKERRADVRPFTSRKRPLGDTVQLFVDRCVMCTRCTRFTREISGASELLVSNRGSREEIDVVHGFPLDNKMSGNVVDLCPVGALADRDFLYQQRVWFMNAREHVCGGCATGCSIYVDENQDHIYRLRPRENMAVNQWWMCDEGRYGFHHVHNEKRLTEPRRRDGEGYANVEWSDVPRIVDQLFSAALALNHSRRLAAVLSPHLTVEEAYLLAKYARSIDANAVVALGPIPTNGEDETFKNGFTIHAEKCPNRRGVAEIVQHFADEIVTFDQIAPRIESGEIAAAWVSGGYKTDWISAPTAGKFESLRALVVQDLFASPLMDRATLQLPGAAFAEREGTFANHDGRRQSFKPAIRPPQGVWTEGQLYWRLLGRPGMYNAQVAMDEIAAEIPFFGELAGAAPQTAGLLSAQ